VVYSCVAFTESVSCRVESSSWPDLINGRMQKTDEHRNTDGFTFTPMLIRFARDDAAFGGRAW